MNFLVYSREVHIAEKLHAMTMPRRRENSRVRDLPDIALLGKTGSFDSAVVRHAIQATFGGRGTHPIPEQLPLPPESWTAQYVALAQSNQLEWPTLDVAFEAASRFIDPILQGEDGQWDPLQWCWQKK